MERNKTIAIITMALLTLSMLVFWTPSVSATPQHRIILPFHTSWENEQPLGRTDAVDWKTSDFYGYYGPDDPLQPELGWRNNEVAPPEVFGFDFGSRQLLAAGYFGSSYSYCYFSLFDTTSDSDYGPPIKVREHTFINIFYHHYKLGNCMIDAQLFNKGTGQFWTLRDFNYAGQYIIDPNGVRIHPACRYNDPIGSWEFASFDLSIVYKSDPENWYITKIWIGFDNDPSIGDGATGQARTYFDMLHISYGIGGVQTKTDGDDNAWTSGYISAWGHWLRPDGYYNLYLKVTTSGFNDGYFYHWTGVRCDLYPFKLKISVDAPNAQAQSDPQPTGVNLTDPDSQWPPPETWEYMYDCSLGIIKFLPGGKVVSAYSLAQNFYGLLKTPEPEPTYQWPDVDWGAPLYWSPKNIALGEVYIEVPGLTQGSHSFSVTFSVDYYWPDKRPFPREWTPVYHETVSFTLDFSWSTIPDYVNLPPETPSKPDGETSGYTGVSYTYSTSTTDPDGDDVYYLFDWGDSSTTTIGPYASDSTVSASHTWGSTGTYYVKVKAYDGYAWSDFSSSLTVTISSNGGGGGGGCPMFYVWNGAEYVCEGLLDIHNPEGVDVIYEHTLVTTPQRENGAYLLRLTEHPQTHSYMDEVKLYAILEDGTMIQLPLIYAWHSEDGNVLPQLLHSDEWKTETLGADLNNGTSQSIDLKFVSLSPNLEIIGFVFEIEGNNPWWKV